MALETVGIKGVFEGVDKYVSDIERAAKAEQKLVSGANDVSKAGPQAAAGIDKLDKSAGGAEKNVGGLGAQLTGVAKIAAGFVLGQALTSLPATFMSLVNAASNMNESMSKAQVVFGDSFAQIDKFASGSAEKVGLTKQATLEMTATFGNLFTAMELGKPEAADLSTKIVQLGADLASFNNIGVEDALGKLRSGLVGEAEPLRSLGIQLTATAVDAKAAELGFTALHGEFTAGEKVQARYALIMEQTKNSQGDFARTSDGFANQMRILKAEFGNVSAELGGHLLPIMTTIVGILLKVTPILAGTLDVLNKIPAPIMLVVGAMVAFNLAIKIPLIQSLIGSLLNMFNVFSVGGAKAVISGINPFIAGMAALGVGLVVLDKVLQSKTGAGLMDHIFGDVGKIQANTAAVKEFNVAMALAGPGASRSAVAVQLLADTQAKLAKAGGDSIAAQNGFANALLGADDRIFGFNIGLSHGIDTMNKYKEIVRQAAAELIKSGASATDIRVEYEKLSPELRKVFADTVDYTSVLAKLQDESRQSATGQQAFSLALQAASNAAGGYHNVEAWTSRISDGKNVTADAIKVTKELITSLGAGSAAFLANSAENAAYQLELTGLTTKTSGLTVAEQARVVQLQSMIAANSASNASLVSSTAALDGMSAHMQLLLGPTSYGALIGAMTDMGVSAANQAKSVDLISQAFSALQSGSMSVALEKLAEAKTLMPSEAFDLTTHAIAETNRQFAEIYPSVTNWNALLPATKVVTDGARTATDLWLVSLKDATGKIDSVSGAIDKLIGKFSEQNPIVIAAKAENAKLTESIDDIKASSDKLTPTQQAIIDKMQAQIDKNDKLVAAYDSNAKAITGTKAAVEGLIGENGYGALLSKLDAVHVNQEDQVDIQGVLSDVYKKMANDDLPGAILALDGLKTSLSPEIWKPIGENLGPAITGPLTTAISEGSPDIIKIIDKARGLGKSMADGVSRGISGQADAVSLALTAVLNAAITTAAGPEGINSGSPSKVTADDLGLPSSEGIGVGIKAGSHFAVDALVDLVNSLPDAVQGSIVGSSQAIGDQLVEKVAKTAIEEFATAMADELNKAHLTDVFGAEGERIATTFQEAFTNPASAANLPKMIRDLIQKAKDAGVPDAEALGAALISAIGNGLQSGSGAAVDEALGAFATAMKVGATETMSLMDTIRGDLAEQATNKKLVATFGSAGVALMDSLSKGITEGSKKNLGDIAKNAESILAQLNTKMGPDQGALLGSKFLDALDLAVRTKTPEAIAALSTLVRQIKIVTDGGVYDVTTGVTIMADQISSIASKLGLSASDVVANIRLLTETGLLNMATALNTVPSVVQRTIDEILAKLAKGLIDVRTARDLLMNASGSFAPTSPGPGQPVNGELPGVQGYDWVQGQDGKYSLVPIDYSDQIGTSYYPNGKQIVPEVGGSDPTGRYTWDGTGWRLKGQVPTGSSSTSANKVTLPGLATGTPFVQSTGAALLHRGEAVIPASMNPATYSRMPSLNAPGGGGGTTVTIDMSGSTFGGSPTENGAAVEAAVRRAVNAEFGREAFLAGS